MSDPFTNPFDAGADADRAAIWEMLVTRDTDAFLAGDWERVRDDFAVEQFEGIAANSSGDPAKWTLAYPTLETYRDRWLQAAEQNRRMPLMEDRRGALFRMTSLTRIDIVGERALAWKQFRADAPLANGERWKVAAQTVYRLHRVAGAWKIVGFVAYLPLDTQA
jgi:hypothetical protein